MPQRQEVVQNRLGEPLERPSRQEMLWEWGGEWRGSFSKTVLLEPLPPGTRGPCVTGTQSHARTGLVGDHAHS